MLGANAAHLDAHRNNIGRYRALLETHLTDIERGYIERRLSEELAVLHHHIKSRLLEGRPASIAIRRRALAVGRL